MTPTDGAQLVKALDAQAALLPYALAVFAVSLPLFVWVGSFAERSDRTRQQGGRAVVSKPE